MSEAQVPETSPLSRSWWHIATGRIREEPSARVPAPGASDGTDGPGGDRAASDAARALEDYRRVVLSLGLRSLTDKTQVFSLEQEKFVRTRLSHSYEVATNASLLLSEVMSQPVRTLGGPERLPPAAPTVGGLLGRAEDVETLRYSLMAACLLHDTGNPPFGHEGETFIRTWFRRHREELAQAAGVSCDADAREFDELYRDLEGYEGNANSLRMALGSSCMYDGRRLNLTATTVAALVKYPWDSSDPRARRLKKFNVFKSDVHRLRSLQNGSPQMPDLLGGERHPLSYLLEASDDLSYATSDLEDSFRMESFTLRDLFTYLVDFAPVDRGLPGEVPAGYRLSPHADLDAHTGPGTLDDLELLARIAGEDADISRFRALRDALEQRADGDGGEIWGASQPDARHLADLPEVELLGTPEDPRHTFVSALKEHPGLSAQERHQLQETYVSRWCDLVRRRLYTSTAQEFVRRAQSGRPFEPDALFGSHRETVRLIKHAENHFVFLSEGRIKTEALAQAIMEDLLQRFVIEAVTCEDPVNAPTRLVRLIPLRYRLDYEDRERSFQERHGRPWSQVRKVYERSLMALDFISSMTDGHALELHRKLS